MSYSNNVHLSNMAQLRTCVAAWRSGGAGR